jgi:hypothetical protein
MKPFFQSSDALFTSAVFMTATWIATQGVQRTDAEPLQQFHVARDGDILLLPVNFEGRSLFFLLDTGSFLTVYDKALPLGTARQIAPVETVCGIKPIEMFDSPNASVGKLSLRSGPLVLQSDLSMLRQVSGQDISGIIGMDFLANYIVQIDFLDGKVSFYNSLPTDPGIPLPIFRDQAGPCVQANLPGLQASEKFLIDTGSVYFGNIKKEPAEVLFKDGKAKPVAPARTAGLVGMETKKRWLVESLTVAGVSCRDIVLTQTQDNLLGLGFLSGYTVTFDFPAGLMYLKKNSRSCQQPDLDLSGLHLLRIAGRTTVYSVDEGSPAAVSGIRHDDVVLSIAGESTDHLSMFAIRRQLCRAGKDLCITVLRGEQTHEAILHLGTVEPASLPYGQ